MIFPEYFPATRDNEYAEKKVFVALQKVSDQFDIFYHKKVVAYQKIPCEIDFVIFDRRKSVLLMEVKGGQISYKEGVWKSNENEMDPLAQIENSKKKFLEKYGLAEKIHVDFCVCFPDSDIAVYPDSLLNYQIISNVHFHDIGTALHHAFKQSQENLGKSLKHVPISLSESEYAGILKKIEGEIKYHIPLSKKVELEDVRIKELTEDQYMVYECCMENRRIVVNGVAGSGKTILALKIAKEHYKSGANVLLLCYNIMLGRTFVNEVNPEKLFSNDGNIIIAQDCHAFIKDKIIDKSFYNDINPGSSREDRESFYSLDVPIRFQADIEGGSVQTEIFDIMLVDESQDFDENVLNLLFRFVKPEGKIILFKDDKQVLFKQNFIPEFNSFFNLRLNKNLRNTKRILRFINKLLSFDLSVNEDNPEGEPVEMKSFQSNADSLKHMGNTIQDLIKKHNISPDDILILTPESISPKHCLHAIEKINNQALKELPNNLVRENDTIYYSRIRKFKGLETQFLFIPNYELFKESNFGDNYMYTALTRARNRLYVYEVKN